MAQPTNIRDLVNDLLAHPQILFIPTPFVNYSDDYETAVRMWKSRYGTSFGITPGMITGDPDSTKVTMDELESFLYHRLYALVDTIHQLHFADGISCHRDAFHDDVFRTYLTLSGVFKGDLDITGDVDARGRLEYLTVGGAGSPNEVNVWFDPEEVTRSPARKRPPVMSAIRGLFSFKNILNGDFGE